MSLFDEFKGVLQSNTEIENADRIVEDLKGFVDTLENKQNITNFTDLQKEAIGKEAFWSDDKNAIVLGSTSSGKTLAAELNMAWQVYGRGKKVIYLVPLRALITEKMADFRRDFVSGELRIYSSSSDYQEYDYELSRGEYDIGVLVYEKFFALYSQGSGILKDCGLIVVDEMHTISDGQRGPKLEFALERLRYSEENPPAILGLSTTECDMECVQKWLGKDKTEIIYNDTRPVEIEERFLCCTGEGKILLKRFNNGKELTDKSDTVKFEAVEALHGTSNKGDAVKKEMLLQIIKNHRNSKIIIYFPSKYNTEALASYIVKSDVVERQEINEIPNEDLCDMESGKYKKFKDMLEYGVTYHNAALTLVARDFIEKNFRNGNINIIVATDTLTVGINLPTDVMVLFNNTDYTKNKIDYSKYKNIIGRAGRLNISDRGYSYVLCKDERDFNKAVGLYSTPKDALKICSGLKFDETYAENATPYFLNVLTANRKNHEDSFEKSDIKNVLSNGLRENAITDEEADKKAEEIIKCLLGEGKYKVQFAKRTDDIFSDEKYAILSFGKYMAPFALKLRTCFLISDIYVASKDIQKKYVIPEALRKEHVELCKAAEFDAKIMPTLDAFDFCEDNRKIKCFVLNILYTICVYSEEIGDSKTYLNVDSNATNDVKENLVNLLNENMDKLYTEAGLFDTFFGDEKCFSVAKIADREYMAMYRAVVLYFWLLGTSVTSIREKKLKLRDEEKYYIYTSEVKQLGEVCAFIFEAISVAVYNAAESKAVDKILRKELRDKLYDISICLKHGMNRNLARIANKHIPGLSRTKLLNTEKRAIDKGYEGFMDYVRNDKNDARENLGDAAFEKLMEEIARLEKMDVQKLYETLKMDGVIDTMFTEVYDAVKDSKGESLKDLLHLLLIMGISRLKSDHNLLHISDESFGNFDILLRANDKCVPDEKTRTVAVYYKDELCLDDTENCRCVQIMRLLKLVLLSVSQADELHNAGKLFLEKLADMFDKSGNSPALKPNLPETVEPAETSVVPSETASANKTINNYIFNGPVDIINGDIITQNNVNVNFQWNQYIEYISQLQAPVGQEVTDEDESKFFRKAEKRLVITETEDKMRQCAAELLNGSSYSLEEMVECAKKLDGGDETRILKALYVEHTILGIFNNDQKSDYDYSPAGVLYGSAVEDYAKRTIVAALREVNPKVKLLKKTLQDYSDDKINIGNIIFMIDVDIHGVDGIKGAQGLFKINSDSKYWDNLKSIIDTVKVLRNTCCHSKSLSIIDAKNLREKAFEVMKKLTECDKLLNYLKGGDK